MFTSTYDHKHRSLHFPSRRPSLLPWLWQSCLLPFRHLQPETHSGSESSPSPSSFYHLLQKFKKPLTFRVQGIIWEWGGIWKLIFWLFNIQYLVFVVHTDLINPENSWSDLRSTWLIDRCLLSADRSLRWSSLLLPGGEQGRKSEEGGIVFTRGRLNLFLFCFLPPTIQLLGPGHVTSPASLCATWCTHFSL